MSIGLGGRKWEDLGMICFRIGLRMNSGGVNNKDEEYGSKDRFGGIKRI